MATDLATALVTAIATALTRYDGISRELMATIEITQRPIDYEWPGGSAGFTFDPDGTYTPAQLDFYATVMLRATIKEGDKLKGDSPILFKEHLDTRHKREIYNSKGVPDPSIQQGMYWKTHPQGRKVNTDTARKEQGASFYR